MFSYFTLPLRPLRGLKCSRKTLLKRREEKRREEKRREEKRREEKRSEEKRREEV